MPAGQTDHQKANVNCLKSWGWVEILIQWLFKGLSEGRWFRKADPCGDSTRDSTSPLGGQTRRCSAV